MRNAILTISSAAKTATSGKFGAVLKSTLFAVLLAAASMAGAVPIPGTPVPITLQTFVVMLAALMLPWKQAGAAVLMYLAAGAAGLPVFAGGASTMALVGPSAGFLIGFLPAAVVTSLLKGKARVDSPKHAALTAARYLSACVAGCIVLDYLLGFIVQSAHSLSAACRKHDCCTIYFRHSSTPFRFHNLTFIFSVYDILRL